MPRSVDEIIAGLPKARRDRIESKAAVLARDMLKRRRALRRCAPA
jgi:hypothetical protein